jgi:hypothetical protein
MKRPNAHLSFASLLLATACGGGSTEAIKEGFNDTSVDVDEDPPVIVHAELGAQQYLQAVQVGCQVTDEESAIGLVKVFYREATQTTWSSLELSPGADNNFTVQIPGDQVVGSSMKYYLTAEDIVGNSVAFPPEGEAGPLSFAVSAD